MRFLPLAAVIVAVAGTVHAAHATDALQVTAVPIPWRVHGETTGAFGPLPIADSTATDSLVFSNTDYSARYIYSPGAGVMFADDVHLALPGRLTQFFFFFNETAQTPVRFTVAIYANDANDSGLGALLGGPYELGPFHWGIYFVHVTVMDTVILGRDAWFAFTIATPSAGLVLANPPSVGTSHDLYFHSGLGRTNQLNGAAANFYLKVFAVPESVPVSEATWSAVKAMFRPGTPVAPHRHD